jgi:mRNA-degrading endonuclease RelE of RelBE toxin-antitoxin system
MKIFYSQRFSKDLNSLPTKIGELFKKQEDIFANNWKDPRLHIKKLINTDLFSFRVTISYRVLFKLADSDSVFFVSIGHRKDIYE